MRITITNIYNLLLKQQQFLSEKMLKLTGLVLVLLNNSNNVKLELRCVCRLLWNVIVKVLLLNMCNIKELSGIFFCLRGLVKVELSPSKKIRVICLIESPLEVMKNALYFILKALFVLKIFTFLSWIFSHLGKTAWLERQG